MNKEVIIDIENPKDNDLISRQAAIDIFDKWLSYGNYNYSERNIMNCAIAEIKELPSYSEIPNKWIPVSERLPENDDFVIVTIKDESGDSPYIYSDFGWYLDKAACWIIDAEQRTDIIAWMPLPQPYKDGVIK